MMTIKIKNLRLDVMLGVYAEERHKKQPVVINLEIDFDPGISSKTDNLNDTLDYHSVVKEVIKAVKDTEFELLESLVRVIEERLRTFKRIVKATIEIDKPEAPIENIDSVSITKTFVIK